MSYDAELKAATAAALAAGAVQIDKRQHILRVDTKSDRSPVTEVDRVVGVMKAYTTRVGEGPLPTENAEIADMLHAMGREFGATTGRPRRCGWFDAVATRHACRVNGIDDLAVTNTDGLDSVETIKVCIAYRDGPTRYDYMPSDIEVLGRCQPVFAEFPGWQTSTVNARSWKDLPAKARSYLKALADLTGARLAIASVGPGRRADDPAVIYFIKSIWRARLMARLSRRW